MKKLLLVTTGGTIASRPGAGGGYAPALSSAELLGSCGELPKDIEMVRWDYGATLSFAITPAMVLEIFFGVRERLARGSWAGAVIVEGTALLEEIPFLFDLFWDDQRPVVFTGAMRDASEPGWDGPENVRNAVVTALSPDAAGMGALVCLGGEIHAARAATKVHKTAPAPISSVNTGPLGLVADGRRAVFHRRPLRRPTLLRPAVEQAVDIVKVAMGTEGRLVDLLAEGGAKGIVLEAFPGGGGVTPSVFRAVERHIGRAVFVMCPRSLGGVGESRAGGGCGPVDLRRVGVITAGALGAVKARIFLMAALAQTQSVGEIRGMFEEMCL